MKTTIVFLLFNLGLISTTFSNNNLTLLIDETLSHSAHQLMNLYEEARKIPNRIPHSVNQEGQLATTHVSNWTSGFFPGSLWYLYEHTGEKKIKEAAMEMTERLRKQQFLTTNHDIGFMIFCSFGNALRITGDKEIESVIINAARSLSTRFNPRTGVIRSWDSKKWQYPVIIDNMMNLELLTQATKISGDSSFYKIAVSHADTTMKYHFREDWSSYHLVSFDTINGGFVERVTHQGAFDESAWARGQAWGLYGYVMMYRETKIKAYLEQAIRIADYIAGHEHLPEDKIPYWDFNAPNIPHASRDASAGAIIASALIELSTFTNNELSEKYLTLAIEMVKSLASPSYLSKPGENGFFILKRSVGFLPRNREVDVPLNYADYYFIEALMRLRKLSLSCSN